MYNIEYVFRVIVSTYKIKKNQNKFSMFLVSLVVLMIMIVVAVRSMELNRRLDECALQEAELSMQEAAEQRRAEEIAELEKYTQTKKWVEEVAKDKLNLIYEGEILFKEQN